MLSKFARSAVVVSGRGGRGAPTIWNQGLKVTFEMNSKLNNRMQYPIQTASVRYFSAGGSTPPAPLSDYDKEVVDELMRQVDMEDLKKFNPKLHDLLQEKPELILELQDTILQNQSKGEEMAAQEAVEAASDNLQYKPQKNYALPFIWAYFAPVFSATAAALIKLQAMTQIPWFSFIVLCGVGVRVAILPLMIRQMTLINKMSTASPNIRLAAKLFKHSKMALPRRVWYFGRAIYNYQKQTKTSLFQFYICNIIQVPIFIIMVLSIRKISYENDDLSGAGMLWFPNLNEADPYLILPISAALLNYWNLTRGITKENEHWFINRFRTFFSVLQFFHLPFTNQWPAGAFVYWISSSSFTLVQSMVMKNKWFLNKVNPNFFYDYAKMFGERSPKDHDNHVERILSAEDSRLKQSTYGSIVQNELEEEMNKFLAFKRGKQIQQAKLKLQDQLPSSKQQVVKEDALQ